MVCQRSLTYGWISPGGVTRGGGRGGVGGWMGAGVTTTTNDSRVTHSWGSFLFPATWRIAGKLSSLIHGRTIFYIVRCYSPISI